MFPWAFARSGKDFGRAGGRMCQVDVAINWFQCFNVAYRAHAVLRKWDYPGADTGVRASSPIGQTDRFHGFSGDDDTLRRGTFHEARGAGRPVAQGLPGDGHDAEGALRFPQTSLRRQVCWDRLNIVLRGSRSLSITNREKRTAISLKQADFLPRT